MQGCCILRWLLVQSLDLFSHLFISVVNGQSPMVNSNETGVNHNMSKPQLHIGMVTMPVACTSLDEALGSATGMTGGSSNETQETIMGRMQNMTSTSGLNATDNNMTGCGSVMFTNDGGRNDGGNK
jgi:hypothetical protein